MGVYIPDPLDLFEQHEWEKEKRLKTLPCCDYCVEPIQDDDLFDIDGALFHIECAEQEFKKPTSNYVEQRNTHRLKIHNILKGWKTNGLPTVNIDVKVTNNYNPANGKTNADIIVFDLQILGKEEEILNTLRYTCEDIQQGDTAWTRVQTGLDISIISGFRVKYYELYIRDRSKPNPYNDGTSSVALGIADFVGAGKLSGEICISYDEAAMLKK